MAERESIGCRQPIKDRELMIGIFFVKKGIHQEKVKGKSDWSVLLKCICGLY
jgi:hypothetical protein